MNQWSESGTLVGTAMIEPLTVTDEGGKPQPWLAETWEPTPTSPSGTSRCAKAWSSTTAHPSTAVLKRNLDAAYQTGVTSFGLKSVFDHVEIVGPRTARVYLRIRWAQYWRKDARGQALPYLDEIEFQVIEDDDRREQALRSGVDLALSTAGTIATDLEGGFDVIKDYDSQHSYLMLNTAVGDPNRGNPFTNVHARRALAYATDRRAIASGVAPGVETTAFGFYQKGTSWQPDGGDGYVDHDPVKAREAIEAYKRDTGAAELSFRLTGPPSAAEQAVLLALKDQWAAVGITARIDAEEPSRLTSWPPWATTTRPGSASVPSPTPT